MNNERKQSELERRLEQATATKPRIDPAPQINLEPQTGLDPEASAWRESWQALGKLLEAGNPEDRMPTKQLLDIPNPPDSSKLPTPVDQLRNVWKKYAPAVAATLAVSLLLAVGMLKFSPSVIPPEEEPPTANNFPWNDMALDFRMTVLDERLTVAGYDSASLGDSFDSAGRQLELLTYEIKPSSMYP